MPIPSKLTHTELELLLFVASQYWTAEDREKIARVVPELYSKFTGHSIYSLVHRDRPEELNAIEKSAVARAESKETAHV